MKHLLSMVDRGYDVMCVCVCAQRQKIPFRATIMTKMRTLMPQLQSFTRQKHVKKKKTHTHIRIRGSLSHCIRMQRRCDGRQTKFTEKKRDFKSLTPKNTLTSIKLKRAMQDRRSERMKANGGEKTEETNKIYSKDIKMKINHIPEAHWT